KCYRMDSAKDVQHKKRHEVLNATPANTEVIMKRLGLQPASVHHTKSILPALTCNVKDNCGKNKARRQKVSRVLPMSVDNKSRPW
ncbi:MAG: hypothetical protein IJO04_02150, partial [Oscillospiraceae bacterium]|nr:hypothetical protein [Oscillospiraceae bacterium]